ncbi:ribosomal protein S18-alanine N-acetyltransferase [Anaerosolibacter sp.]|uniref:ribosomal protein S18-alanine N-acetyltransferase n=1 Tax=Anaerosolibacter sp. TaxID=1872527 RepID=UPI0039EEB5EC
MGVIRARSMTVEDIPQVLEIENLCFTVPWSPEAFEMEISKNKFAQYVVAEVDGRIAGYGGMWFIVDEAHVTNIAVHPQYRGKGYGELIVAAMVRRADDQGIYQMTLEVRASNHVAQNLYRKFGFEPCGVRPKYYADNNEDAVIMWRTKENG